MRILFTGATSFTGMWFVETLAGQGHTVIAAIRSGKADYSGLKAERLARVVACCRPAWNVPFGSAAFLDAIAREGPFDVFCHHAAETADYKNPDFDAVAATGANTRSVKAVLRALGEVGCRCMILTGSFFEANEGAGNAPLHAFSAYGLSKTLTSQIFRFHAVQQGFVLGKFVIPNPFGPYEEPRFTESLMRCWLEGKTACVRTPRYVRDNIHVSLLSEIYGRFVRMSLPGDFHTLNPSGYVESQGAFASRFASEINRRLRIETPIELADQTEFPEPAVRINTDIVRDADWDESAAWDGLADYYAGRFAIGRR